MILLVLISIIFLLLSVIFQNKIINRIIILLFSIFYIIFTILVLLNIKIELNKFFNIYFTFDSLSKLFLLILSIVFFSSSIYSISYLKHHDFDRKWDTIYTISIILFIVAMTGSIASSNFGLMWVFIEATTLFSTILIMMEREKSSIEAAWKYIFICSIGISFAYIGIILLSIAGKNINSLFFEELYKNYNNISLFWLKLAFVFIFIGFGTKAGIGPLHAWLPDAHSEAPSPISALLSGALLNIALLAIFRFNKLMILCNLYNYVNIFYIITGVLSLMISASFIIKIKNYKRMLAYSSIENIGLIILGLGFGKTGIYASLLTILFHSLLKTSLFLTSGNIYTHYNSKFISDIHDLNKVDGLSAWIWLLSIIGLSSIPPFPTFFAKFLLIKSIFQNNYLFWLSIIILFLIIIIVYGLFSNSLKMIFSKSEYNLKDKRLELTSYLIQIIILVIIFLLSLYFPDFLKNLIENSIDLII